MDKLVKERGIIRTNFTKLCKQLEETIAVPETSHIDIKAQLTIMENKVDVLRNLDVQIFDLMLDSNDESELEIEMSKQDEYQKRFLTLKFEVESLEINADRESIASNRGTQEHSSYKLPRLELKKYNGELLEWLSFWSQFSKIHEDSNLASEDKFQYLIQAMEEGSKSRELVLSFPPTAKNYPKVIESLKDRYGQEDMLVEVYIRELLKLVIKNVAKSSPIVNVYDKLESSLRALDSLGITAEKCAPLLYPLVESSLSEDVLRTYRRNVASDPSPTGRLENLMKFLKNEIEAEQRISMAMEGFGLHKRDSRVNITKDKPPRKETMTAAGLFVKNENRQECLFCSKEHKSCDCFNAQKLTYGEKQEILKTKRACFSCLKVGHNAKRCKAKLKCIVCAKHHVPLMCPKLEDKDKECKGNLNEESEATSLASFAKSRQVFLQTLKVIVKGPSSSFSTRVLIDTGSQRSYILKETARKLGYIPLRQETIVHSLFGGHKTDQTQHSCYKVELESLNRKYRCNFEAIDQAVICDVIPSVNIGPWTKELKFMNIAITDVEENPGPIEILIGADIAGKLLTGQRKILSCGLVAIETYLGWCLMGKVPRQTADKENITMNTTVMFVKEASIENLWKLDVLGIQDPIQKKSKEDTELATLAYFNETVKINDDGRYEVRLPWISEHFSIPRNFNLAKRRLHCTLQKLKRDNTESKYDEVFLEWLREGIIEEIPMSRWNEGHYLPHRPVIKESGTTKIRPVFDASAREDGYPSLNQCLEKGINLIEIIPTLLLRFRLHQIGVISDIRKAFLQVSLCEKDRDFLRFLWVQKDGNMKIFRHKRVVFGVTSSPFLLSAVIDFHLKKYLQPIEKNKYSISMIEKLRKSFYVDNCISSVQSENELQYFMNQATLIFAEAKFDLRGWEYSRQPILLDESDTPVLGLNWNKTEDTIAVKGSATMKVDKVTRRTILSAAQQVFDPIGFVCPTSLRPKLLLQQCWSMKGGWDEEVQEDIKKSFLKWLQHLPLIENVRIPRWIIGMSDKVTNCSIHTFCDASKLAYAAAVFIRIEYGSFLNVQLIQAKSRVAPLKPMTIPRLELLAATVGARLATSIRNEFNPETTEFYFWTDSSTVIAWIRRDEQWGIFVYNRVQEIRKLTKKDQWRHVPGILNPADLPSRGCSPSQLLESKWWEGPAWLKLPSEEWPSEELDIDHEIVMQEKKKGTVCSLLCESHQTNWYYSFSNDFEKILRVIAWMKRFINNCKNPTDKLFGKQLTCQEISKAEKQVIKLIQKETFQGVEDAKLSTLRPFLDIDGIIRLKTKITERIDSEDFKMPAVLPHKHPVVEILIFSTHVRACHVGVQGLISILREKFWILKSRKTVRTSLRKCVVCRRYDSKPVSVNSPALPEARVREAAVFETTGIDFAGPLFLKGGNKVWICLFTCAVYRAVHLEITHELSSDYFIQVLRRFVARRGRPRTIYSDNGTNFSGTSNCFSRLDWDKICKYSCAERIDWKFNPPTAAWWGGWWERLIRLLKQLLRKILGKASLTYEELYTVLCDCESVMNSRPLTYVSEDSSDLVPITPNMFLMDNKEVGVPDCDAADFEKLNKRAKYRQKIRERLRHRFRREYLGELRLAAQKKKESLLANEVVLIEAENKKRTDWPLAIVEELIPGRGGEIRLVKLRTASGTLLRPVQRVYRLEVCDQTV